MIGDAAFDELVQLIYAAAERPELWSEILIRSTQYMAARSGSLMLFDKSNLGLTLEVAPQIDPKLSLEMREWGSRDIWLQSSHGSPIWQEPGRVFESQEFVPDEIVLKSDYYHECLTRLGISQTVGCLLFSEESISGTLNYYYASDAGLRTPEQMELARRVTPHVQNALRLHRRFQRLETTATAFSQSFERLGSGLLMLSEDARPLYVNRAAEAMLACQDGIRQKNGRIGATNTDEDALIKGLVRQAALTSCGAGSSGGGVARITRPSGKAPWIVTVMPISDQGQLFQEYRAVAVMTICDLASAPVPATAHLRSLFGFTNAESAVAELLMQGFDRAEIADLLRISLNTVRAHLRSLFAKTGVTTQAKLVRLLLIATRTVPGGR